MKNTRRLALRGERLAELQPDELARAGGWAPPTLRPECTLTETDTEAFMLQLTLHKDCSWSCIR